MSRGGDDSEPRTSTMRAPLQPAHATPTAIVTTMTMTLSDIIQLIAVLVALGASVSPLEIATKDRKTQRVRHNHTTGSALSSSMPAASAPTLTRTPAERLAAIASAGKCCYARDRRLAESVHERQYRAAERRRVFLRRVVPNPGPHNTLEGAREVGRMLRRVEPAELICSAVN